MVVFVADCSKCNWWSEHITHGHAEKAKKNHYWDFNGCHCWRDDIEIQRVDS